MNLSSPDGRVSSLGQSHMRLADLIQAVRVASSAAGLPAQRTLVTQNLADCARRLHVAMLEHFREEEAEGYLSDVLDVAPHLAHQVRVLQEDHSAIGKTLTEWLERTSTRSFNGEPDGCQLLLELVERLEAHEAAEGDLLELAFTDDLGNKD